MSFITDEWIMKMHIYTMEYYSALKKIHEICRWMDALCIILRKITQVTQTQKNKCHVFSFIYESYLALSMCVWERIYIPWSNYRTRKVKWEQMKGWRWREEALERGPSGHKCCEWGKWGEAFGCGGERRNKECRGCLKKKIGNHFM